MITVDRTILIFAFRYALGRSSTAPSIVIEEIEKNMRNLELGDLRLMVREIQECERFGMQMDKNVWFALMFKLISEIERKQKEV